MGELGSALGGRGGGGVGAVPPPTVGPIVCFIWGFGFRVLGFLRFLGFGDLCGFLSFLDF